MRVSACERPSSASARLCSQGGFLMPISDIVIGAVVEVGFVALLGAFVYRNFAGRFLIPKRETVPSYQKGVLLRGDAPARVVEPGSCWVRPGSRLMLCDMRARALQIENFEVLTADNGVVRLNLSGEYKIADPDLFIAASGNAVGRVPCFCKRSAKVFSPGSCGGRWSES